MRIPAYCFLLLLATSCHTSTPPPTAATPAPPAVDSPQVNTGQEGGSGRFYMGREIAAVMGHEGATWLERPERQREEDTDRLLAELSLAPNSVVADIGAGTGYYTFRLARLLRERGRVLAVDIQPEMLAELEKQKGRLNLPNVEVVAGTEKSPNLKPNSVDLVLLVDAYHEFSYPREMATAIYKALKPGGRVALVEFRAEQEDVLIKPAHKMTVAQARKEWQALGFVFREVNDRLPWQHLIFFEKSAE